MCVIRIGGEQAEYLAINLLGRSYPACQDYWDGNWMRAEVEVVVGGFGSRVTGDLRTDELARFHEQFSRLQESLRGTAEFVTFEGWLSVRVVGDGRGHMRLQCEVRDEPGVGNTLIGHPPWRESLTEPIRYRDRCFQSAEGTSANLPRCVRPQHAGYNVSASRASSSDRSGSFSL